MCVDKISAPMHKDFHQHSTNFSLVLLVINSIVRTYPRSVLNREDCAHYGVALTWGRSVDGKQKQLLWRGWLSVGWAQLSRAASRTRLNGTRGSRECALVGYICTCMLLAPPERSGLPDRSLFALRVSRALSRAYGDAHRQGRSSSSRDRIPPTISHYFH